MLIVNARGEALFQDERRVCEALREMSSAREKRDERIPGWKAELKKFQQDLDAELAMPEKNRDEKRIKRLKDIIRDMVDLIKREEERVQNSMGRNR